MTKQKIKLFEDRGTEHWSLIVCVDEDIQSEIHEEDFQPDDYFHKVKRSLELTGTTGEKFIVKFTDKPIRGIEEKLPKIAVYQVDGNNAETYLTENYGVQTIPETLIMINGTHETLRLWVNSASRELIK